MGDDCLKYEKSNVLVVATATHCEGDSSWYKRKRKKGWTVRKKVGRDIVERKEIYVGGRKRDVDQGDKEDCRRTFWTGFVGWMSLVR